MLYTLTAADERRLVRVIRGNDPVAAMAARDQLVTANLGLVHVISDRLCNMWFMSEYDDAVSEGMLALLHSAVCFDPDRSDVKFGSYAGVAIHRAIRRYLSRHHQLHCVELDDVVDPDSPPPDAVHDCNEELAELLSRVEDLDPLRRRILVARLGLLGGKGRTMTAIAAELELPLARVWYLYRLACGQLSA
jgi:RNA polymerase sigma factor (sigma-70 family)